MKLKPTPTPLPTPKLSLFHDIPIINSIPENIAWVWIGAIFTVVVHYVYGLVIDRRSQGVEIAMKNALHQAHKEWNDGQTENMISILKLEHRMGEVLNKLDRFDASIEQFLTNLEQQEKRISRLENRR